MPIFTFYLHETPDAVPSFEIGLFDDADAAVAEAERLLKERPRYSLVEITSEDQAVARVAREAAVRPAAQDRFTISFAQAD